MYLKRRKEYLIERNILLNVKLNKNNIESEKIDSKIKEINNNMDTALDSLRDISEKCHDMLCGLNKGTVSDIRFRRIRS